MAAFSYQQHNSFLLDQTVFGPNPNNTAAIITGLPQFHQHHDHLGPHYDQVYVANKLHSPDVVKFSNLDDQKVMMNTFRSKQLIKSPTPDSSMSMVLDDQKVDSGSNELLAKKRKDKQMAQSKDTSNRMKKQKKTNDYQDEKKKKITKKASCEDEEEGAIGYIHVRARRGQATDSHSLAERVRREKISERMKLLQSIVPGCDKITGKALMLDEIINYVQSLQNQVEFLSMKLASVNPMLYDFGMDLDAFMLKPDENMSSMVHPIMTSVQECSPNGGAATFAPATNNYHRLPQIIDISPTTTTNSLLFQQDSQMTTNILSQGNGQQMWDDEQRLIKLDNSFALSNNVTSFH